MTNTETQIEQGTLFEESFFVNTQRLGSIALEGSSEPVHAGIAAVDLTEIRSISFTCKEQTQFDI